MQRLLEWLAPLVVYLLRLRELALQTPERLAIEAIPEEVLKVVARLSGISATSLTCEHFGMMGRLAGKHCGAAGCMYKPFSGAFAWR